MVLLGDCVIEVQDARIRRQHFSFFLYLEVRPTEMVLLMKEPLGLEHPVSCMHLGN